ncbi:MAG: hypothetical protein WCA50_15475, partial [Candidatus Sulfotelmatobacter sp.]
QAESLRHRLGPEQSIGTARTGTDQKRTLILAKDRNAYSGKFTIDQYYESGNLLAHPACLSNQMDE